MDGSFSIETAHHIFKGHFRTAPLGFVDNSRLSAFHLMGHHSNKTILVCPQAVGPTQVWV